jgi:DNA-binding response OmpR family regulator
MDLPNSILICDDEAPIRQLVATKLRGAGYHVIEARDGREGLEQAIKQPPALIVTDLQMPNLSGLEMVRELRKNEVTRLVPVIMLTARGYFVAEDEAKALLIREIVAKPFGLKALLDRVSAVISAEAGARSANAA